MQLTIEEIRQLAGMQNNPSDHPFEVGQKYCIRTVTMIQTGRLVAVHPNELVLEDAAWIADTGRFADFVSGKIEPSEVEPFPKGSRPIVGRGSIIDAVKLERELPLSQK